MFCPGCGMEEKQANQFCRACGTDLRRVRFALENPDQITASASAARNEIGQAIAYKIREANSAAELAVVAEEVLPEIEKFLESPEEKRMRRIRNGTIVSSIGLGGALAFTLVSIFFKEELMVLAGFGLVTLFIGLGLLVNGLLFTLPRRRLSDNISDAESQRRLDSETSELVLPESNQVFTSITEHTTHQLKSKQPLKR